MRFLSSLFRQRRLPDEKQVADGTCPTCGSDRLQDVAIAYGRSIADGRIRIKLRAACLGCGATLWRYQEPGVPNDWHVGTY